MTEHDPCTWAHQVQLNPDSPTARFGIHAQAHGWALLTRAWADEAAEHEMFWRQLRQRLQEEDFREAYKQALREL